MNQYQCIIVAVDLNPETDDVTMARAKQLAGSNNDALHSIHIIEPINTYGMPYFEPAISNIENKISPEHKQELITKAERQGIPTDTLIIKTGMPSTIIVNQAKKISADLIIIGTHSRHGLALLFGSTTDSVLHNSPCDVLTVHLKH